MASDQGAEQGSAGAEVLPFCVLIFVFGTLLLVNAWGVIDAHLHYEPRVLVEGDQELLPPELRQPEKKKQPPRRTSSLLRRLHVSPMVTPESVGIGIGWEN